jgi:penicillin-binding protein 2
MRAVTMGARGTARKAALKIPDWEMAGKTGTVQVRRISLAERKAGITKNADRRWRDRDHALFVAFAPYDAPRYAIAVVVEHGGSGSSVAAPIARDVIAELHRLNPLGNRDQAGRAGLPTGRKG